MRPPMKLARDSWLLFAVPAAVLLAGGWWIVGGSASSDDVDTVRFRLAERDEACGRGAASERGSPSPSPKAQHREATTERMS